MDRRDLKRIALRMLIIASALCARGIVFADVPSPFLARTVPQPSDPLRKTLFQSPAPGVAQALKIAEAYYATARKDATPEERTALAQSIGWTPDFTGKTVDRARAALLANPTALFVSWTDLKGFYLAHSAALFALDAGNATYAGNLASAIVTYSEDASGKPLAEIVGASRPYVDNAAALYEYALTKKLAGLFVDVDALPLLLNYGHLCIDADRLEKAKALFSAALAIAPDYPPAREGMAAYWIAKGDKEAAKRALGDRLPSAYRKTAEVNRKVTEEKTPDVEAGDGLEIMTGKLGTLGETPTVLATDFYQDLAPEAADEARRLVDSLAAEFRYTAPTYSYLSQYSTLKVFRGSQGRSAMKAFEKEFGEFARTHFTVGGRRSADVLEQVGLKVDIGGMSMEQAMEQAMADPKKWTKGQRGRKVRIQGLDELQKRAAEMKREMNQADADSRRGAPEGVQSLAAEKAPELAIFAMKPSDFANPTDLLVQKYDMWILQKKLRGHKNYMSKENKFIREEIAEKGKRLDKEMAKLKEGLAEELRKLEENRPDDEEEYKRKLHEIHRNYHPRMNNLAETGWMDSTNLVNARYMQRAKPGVERMYADLMRHCLLISDPKVRGRMEREIETEVYAAVIAALTNVAGAYANYDSAYPFECNCDEGELEAARERKRQEREESDAAATAARNRARREFEQGVIKETSQLYKRLDAYSAEFNLFFMRAKWHPLKTELTYKIEMGDFKADFKMVENHVRDMTTYGGGVTATKEMGPAKLSAGLRGWATVDGSGNVVGGDLVSNGSATVTAGSYQATAGMEVSVMRGSKASVQVAELCETQAKSTMADNVREKIGGIMGIAKEEEEPKIKRVLWSGEYKL